MILAVVAIAFGLALLVWSAERFVGGSASTARHLGMPPLLIGMVIVGFGTSAPEMVVSALAASQGNPGLALGNAYGSNITNIALILGLTALISPVVVHSQVLRKELPILTAVTALAAYQVWDGKLTRVESLLLLSVFGALMAWTIWQGLGQKADALGNEMEHELEQQTMPIGRAVVWLVVGLVLLIASSRILVWGAVELAQGFGVSDLIIGLTIVAVGTSLPELATSVAAALKRQTDIALGNIIGSNLFNILGILGTTALVRPMRIPQGVVSLDAWVLLGVTGLLLYYALTDARLSRSEGAVFLVLYASYVGLLASGAQVL